LKDFIMKKYYLTEQDLLAKGLMKIKILEPSQESDNYDPEIMTTKLFKGRFSRELPQVERLPNGQYFAKVHKDFCALPTGAEEWEEIQRVLDLDHLGSIASDFKWIKHHDPRVHIIKYISPEGVLIGYIVLVLDGQHTGHAYDDNGLNTKKLPDDIDGRYLYTRVGPLEEGDESLTFMDCNQGSKKVSDEWKTFNFLNQIRKGEAYLTYKVFDDDQKVKCGIAIGVFHYLKDRGIIPRPHEDKDSYNSPEFYGFSTWVNIFATALAPTVRRDLKSYNKEHFEHEDVTNKEVITETMRKARKVMDIAFDSQGEDEFMYLKGRGDVKGTDTGHAHLMRAFIILLDSDEHLFKGQSKKPYDRWAVDKGTISSAIAAGRFYNSMGHVNAHVGVRALRKLCEHDQQLAQLSSKRGSAGTPVGLVFAMERMIMTAAGKGHLHKIPTLEEYEARKKSKAKAKPKNKSKKASQSKLF
jgi:hypothetical protein